eukprot:3664500-Rhodomonas_salina.1
MSVLGHARYVSTEHRVSLAMSVGSSSAKSNTTDRIPGTNCTEKALIWAQREGDLVDGSEALARDPW